MAAFEELMLQLDAHPSQWADDNRRKEVWPLKAAVKNGTRWVPIRARSFYFRRSAREHALATPSLVGLSRESISEHVEKARAKIAAGDSAGAITNAYSLVEAFLKEILRQTNTPFKETEGDIFVPCTAVPLMHSISTPRVNTSNHTSEPFCRG